MKKTLTLIALLISLCCNAQTIETKSSCDSNADGQVTVADVTNTANKVIGKAVTEKQVVTADDLNTLLQLINEKLEKLSSIESRLSAIEEKLGIESPDEPTEDDPYNGHEYVDLGLPSGLKWATMNVAATEVAGSKKNSHTGQLDCYGEYYAWGETSPKDTYDWSSYTLCKGSKTTMTKYCKSSSYGTVDDKTTLELSDDAARANWGGSWRMPTITEQQELTNNCYWEWTTSYNNSGVKGYIVYKAKNDSDKGIKKYSGSSTTTSASYSLSDTHIFLPASGYRDVSSFYYVGSDGDYWSSSLCTDYSYYAYSLIFYSVDVYSGSCSRYYGFPIRPVCP